jgi:hypothetical protein
VSRAEPRGLSDADGSSISGRGAVTLVTASPADVAAALGPALHQSLKQLLEVLPLEAAEAQGAPARTQHRLTGLLLQLMLRLYIAAAGVPHKQAYRHLPCCYCAVKSSAL